MKTPQEEGTSFEQRFAERLGTEPQPGSGNQWYAKLDVDKGEILFSLKWTGNDSLTLSKGTLSEAIEEATKIGSKGAIPAWATEVDGEDFITFRAEDILRLLEEQVEIIPVTRGDDKRAQAAIPAALRGANE